LLKISENNFDGEAVKCNSYTIYDNSGKKIFRFSDSPDNKVIDVKASAAAIADAYISNLLTPYVVDIKCIESGVELLKKGKTIDEAISGMNKYYDRVDFDDGKYLLGFNALAPRFDDEVFRNLMEKYYFHLAF